MTATASTKQVSAPPPAGPVNELPMSVATEELTGYEVLKVQAHFKTDLSELGPARLLMAVIWVYECRRLGKVIGWPDIEAMTIRQLGGYFAPEPSDPDEADEWGKDENTTSG